MAALFQIPIRPVPAAFTTRSLANDDNGGVFTVAGAETATVPAGLTPGFNAFFNGAGALGFTASSTTVTDERVAGATNPSCNIVCTAADTYKIIGSKA